MKFKTEKYNHHGTRVSVIQHLKGKHREHCLCYGCKKFKPMELNNCDIANSVYILNKLNHITTPVYECPDYESND